VEEQLGAGAQSQGGRGGRKEKKKFGSLGQNRHNVYVHACKLVWMYVCTFVCMCVCVCVCVCVLCCDVYCLKRTWEKLSKPSFIVVHLHIIHFIHLSARLSFFILHTYPFRYICTYTYTLSFCFSCCNTNATTCNSTPTSLEAFSANLCVYPSLYRNHSIIYICIYIHIYICVYVCMYVYMYMLILIEYIYKHATTCNRTPTSLAKASYTSSLRPHTLVA
jgi:hypothetical protein